ncbi:lipopolysaccharide biosynthesis protein [Mycolicibacterium palauense]|uniref:lipopolysaccharide biosynthesis protein n=1 Tax=Mycolicibacterium palauense TaxID=2034511 RepID=UPI00159BB8FD|nr:lipopolysaccharide biosynthesis protein [Mycolicibacterium palauense]
MSIELGLATLLGPIGGFFANVVFARTLGASGRGDLAAIIAALAVCDAILAFGLPDVLARHLAKNSIPPGAQRTAAMIAVGAAIIPGILVMLYTHRWNFSWPVAVAAGLIVPVSTATVVGRGVLVGRHAYRKLTMSQIAGGLVRLFGPLILLVVDRPTEDLALSVWLCWILAAAIPIFACRPFAGRAAPLRDVIPLLKESATVWPVRMSWLLRARLDQLVLAGFVSPADLGRYAVGVGIAEAPVALANGPRQVLLARAAKSHNLDDIPKIAYSILTILSLVGLVAGFFSDPLLGAVFGPDFRGIGPILGVMLAATGFEIAVGLQNGGLIAVGYVRSAAINQFVVLLATGAILPIVLAMGGGILSAAVMRLAAAAIACSLAHISVQSFRRTQRSTPP